MTRALVIEDDGALASAMTRGLQEAGFATEVAATVEYGIEKLLSGEFDVAILDLGLPDGSGFDVMKAALARSATPIIVVTARELLDDRVAAFEAGAVDYLTKPFFTEEWVLRIRVRLKEKRQAAHLHRFGDVVCDFEAFEFHLADQPIALTRVEAQVLRFLIGRPNRALSRAQIARHALSFDRDVGDRAVDAHITKLRKKLGDDASAI
jgi:two-component system OmpR family response regulator